MRFGGTTWVLLCQNIKTDKIMGLFSALFGSTGYEDAKREWNKYEGAAKAKYGSMANQGINNTAYQQALAAERDLLKDNLNTIKATSAVTGATPAAEAIAREQAMKTIADSTAKMGANITADKNQAMANYLQTVKDATAAKANAAIQQAAAETQAGAQLIGSIGGMAGKMLGGLGGM